MSWTEEQIRDHNQRVLNAERLARGLARGVSSPEPKRHPSPALVKEKERAEARLGKIAVRIVCRRTRLLDADNNAASVKGLLDGLCKAGLLPDDSPNEIILTTEQEKVGHARDQETIIEITYP